MSLMAGQNLLLLALDGLTFSPQVKQTPFNLKEWRENIKQDEYYLYKNSSGIQTKDKYRQNEGDKYRRSIGNMFPLTEQGKELLQAYKAKLIKDNK